MCAHVCVWVAKYKRAEVPWFSMFYFLLGVMRNQSFNLEKGMATHSSVLARRIPWTEEPGGLQSMGSQESDTAEATHITRSPLTVKLSMFFLIPDTELEATWSFVEVSSQWKKHSFFGLLSTVVFVFNTSSI